jgi:hypothetical protein
MMSSTDTIARGEVTDMETGLTQLMGRGYQFVHPRNADGEVVAVVGVRVHDNVIDVVRLHAEDDVQAVRMPGDERDILAPKTVYWESSGSVRTVLNQVLALPEEHTPDSSPPAAGPGQGCWVPGESGRSKWLAAS